MAVIRDLRKTVYLTTPGTHVGLEHECLVIRRPEEQVVRAPLRALDGVVCFGRIEISTPALERCAAHGISVSWVGRGGRYRAGLRGPLSGNVLLRVEQYARAADEVAALDIARPMVAAKVLNGRTLLVDAAKDRHDRAATLRLAADELARVAAMSKEASSLNELRGIEGVAARTYFEAYSRLLAQPGFELTTRERRPPRDPVNALLSFCYGLLRIRCEAAVEHLGFDPQVGFLHAIRPGRPSLALDLMEELRPPLAERLVLTLVNRRQVSATSFEVRPGGAVVLSDSARTTVLAAWDAHLSQAVPVRVLDSPVERRQIPHLQALLLARYLRRDLAHYIPHRTIAR